MANHASTRTTQLYDLLFGSADFQLELSGEASRPLNELSRPLPPSLQSALLIALHISPTHASLLPDVLSRAGPLPAEHGRDGTRQVGRF